MTSAVTSEGEKLKVLLLPTITVCVVAAADDVPVPVLEPEAVEEEVAAADVLEAAAWRLAPTANAEFLKDVNEVLVPSAPQLIAKTMPCPQ